MDCFRLLTITQCNLITLFSWAQSPLCTAPKQDPFLPRQCSECPNLLSDHRNFTFQAHLINPFPANQGLFASLHRSGKHPIKKLSLLENLVWSVWSISELLYSPLLGAICTLTPENLYTTTTLPGAWDSPQSSLSSSLSHEIWVGWLQITGPVSLTCHQVKIEASSTGVSQTNAPTLLTSLHLLLGAGSPCRGGRIHGLCCLGSRTGICVHRRQAA